MILLKKMIE